MVYTASDIDNMSASQYAAKLSDPEFIAAVNAMSGPVDVLDPETGLPAVPKTVIETVNPETVVAAVAAVVAPAELTEQRYEWQPTDETGKPFGGKQVLIYKTHEELIQKFTEQNNSILRQMRKLSRDARLGLTPEQDVPTRARRLPESFGTLKPKQLNADERYQLTQDLNDPAKFEDAKVRLSEATFGATPDVITEVLNQSQRLLLENQVIRSFDEFIDRVGTDGFYNVEANRETLTKWMGERNLEPTADNFEIALARTSALLVPAPAVQLAQAAPVATVEPEPKPKVPSEADLRIASEQQTVQNARRQTPSGLNDRVSSSNGAAPVSDRSLTLAEVDKMSADEYGKRVKSDPTFLATVDKLQKEADLRRAARQR
jgi:hypothetical protein